MENRKRFEKEKKFCHACGGWGFSVVCDPAWMPQGKELCPVCNGAGVTVVLLPVISEIVLSE